MYRNVPSTNALTSTPKLRAIDIKTPSTVFYGWPLPYHVAHANKYYDSQFNSHFSVLTLSATRCIYNCHSNAM